MSILKALSGGGIKNVTISISERVKFKAKISYVTKRVALY